MDPDLTRALFSAFIVVAIMLLVGFPIHEALHAWTAYKQGDNTARWAGRVTLDPRVHIDQFGALFLAGSAVLSALSSFGFIFGWAKPTPVNPLNMRRGRQSHALVAFAGPASNIVVAALVAIPLRIFLATDNPGQLLREQPLIDLAWSTGLLLLSLNILLFIFNMIPVPPLDGWAVLKGLIPNRNAYQLEELEARYANVIPMLFFGVIILLFWTGLLSPVITWIRNLLLGI